jgi:GNAT superfamily N-acetyltransferase
MTSWSIRLAGVEDLPALEPIYRRASLSNAGDRYLLLDRADVLVWSGTGLDEGRTVVAVTEEGDIVGFATIGDAGESVELQDLFVDPDFQRQGAARRLTQAVVALARGGGARWIGVVANPHAAAFYAAVGFVPAGVEETPFGSASRLRLCIAEAGHGIDDDVAVPVERGCPPAPSAGHQSVDEPLEPFDGRRE